MSMRTERDFLGEAEIPKDALYGIHSWRAVQNFPDHTAFSPEWYKAIGLVKLACYETYDAFKAEAISSFGPENLPISFMDQRVLEALKNSAEEVSHGKYFDSFIVPAVQGGAGTSINMNVNEIIANAALKHLGQHPGTYSVVDPLLHANIYQSTNDVIPTALRLAVMPLLHQLENQINKTRQTTEALELKFRSIPRTGYTQLQEAVPSNYGRLFAAYSDALSRDWWRVSKAWERIKVVNLGGGAIGTGISVPRFFIMEVVQHLKDLSKLPLSRAENPGDVTSNLDALVEVSAILKAHAVNLEKMSNDLRMLASDITKTPVYLPQQQVGSSMMPGKVNPVIAEFVISMAHKVYAIDMLITSLSARSDLELNAYLPIIGHALIENIKGLIAANQSLESKLLAGIEIDAKAATADFYYSPALTTALSPFVGYHKAAQLAKTMKENHCTIFEANELLQLMDSEKLNHLMKPENLTSLGFSLKDIIN